MLKLSMSIARSSILFQARKSRRLIDFRNQKFILLPLEYKFSPNHSKYAQERLNFIIENGASNTIRPMIYSSRNQGRWKPWCSLCSPTPKLSRFHWEIHFNKTHNKLRVRNHSLPIPTGILLILSQPSASLMRKIPWRLLGASLESSNLIYQAGKLL